MQEHSYRTLVVERHTAGYAFLTLNRPEKLNALSMELRDELVSAIEELGAISGARAHSHRRRPRILRRTGS